MEKNTLFKHFKEHHSTTLHRDHNPIDMLGGDKEAIRMCIQYPHFHCEQGSNNDPNIYLENLI